MPKIVNHDEYREKLLNQCFELFAQQGYAALSMRRIAEELEVSTGTLYHYFRGKEELFNQLVESITTRDLFDVEEALRGKTTLDQRVEALLGFVKERETYFLHQSFIWMDYYRHGMSGRESDARLQRTWDCYRSEIGRMLNIGDRDLADFILAAINGLVLQRYFDRGETLLMEQSKFLRRLIGDQSENQSFKEDF